nr:uncharacterized protein LOC119183146 [Rhipicephalus microplus]
MSVHRVSALKWNGTPFPHQSPSHNPANVSMLCILTPLARYPHGNRYLLTCVDRFTCWPEVTPMADLSAAIVAAGFVSTWISRFGCATTIVSDRGHQFKSFLFSELLKHLGISRLHTASYYPQTNGLVERFHRHLKAAGAAHGCPDRFVDHLLLTLLGIQSYFKEELSCSTSELVYETSLYLPADCFEESGSATQLTATEYVEQLRGVSQ